MLLNSIYLIFFSLNKRYTNIFKYKVFNLKIYNFFVLFIILSGSLLLADCELVEDTKYTAYQQFKEAEDLYDNLQYSDAYEKLLESFKTYAPADKSIELAYSCVNYIPGAYAPIIKRSSKKETFDFDRKALGKDIKKQLSPAPYVFIEFQKNRTIVSAVNAKATPRGELKGRLPLENFTVTLKNETLAFNKLSAGEVKRLSTKKAYSPNTPITTNEDFNFKLYK